MSSKHALVTGALGFTGRFMVDELRRYGYRVTEMGSQPSSEADYRQVDLTDAQSVMRCLADVQPDYVVHLAAIAFVHHGDANAFYQVNLIGTHNLLQAVAAMGKPVRRVLLASSANVYGNATSGMITEAAELAPANDYAVSKMAMESMARLWQDRLPLVITRPFNYTGAGQSEQFLLPKIVAHFRHRAPVIELGNLDVSRDFSDVRALAEAYRRLLEADSAGKTVNVCSGRCHSLADVISLCERISGHRLEIRVNPAFVRANEVRSLWGSADYLRGLIGEWQTPPLEETLSWMLNQA